MFISSNVPQAPLGTGQGHLPVWTQVRVTASLRGVVALAGLPATEYALHSLLIGGDTFQLARRASADVVQRGGRCKSDACKGYVRFHGVDAEAVSDMLADADEQPALQLSQRPVRDING